MALTKITNDGVDFSGTTDINIDSGTFVVDASTNRVGVGTSSPENNLHIFTDTSDEGVLIKSTGNTSNALVFDANRSSAGGAITGIKGRWNGTTVAQINFAAGSDTTNKDDGIITFGTESAASNGNVNAAEKMRIDSSGRVGIGTSSPQKDLVVSDGGAQGIEFAAAESGTSRMLAYNRSTTAYVPLQIEGSTLQLITGSGTNALHVDSSQRVGIGTTSIYAKLEISGNSGGRGIRLSDGENLDISAGGSANDPARLATSSGSGIAFAVNGTSGEDVRIDSSGRLLVGTTSTSSSALLQVQGNSSSSTGDAIIQLRRGENNANVLSGESLGSIQFSNSESTVSAVIEAVADANWNTTNDYPSRIVFSTTADGASSPTERFRIHNDGYLYAISNSTGNTNLTLRNNSSSADATDFFQLRDNANNLELVIKPDGDVENANNSYTGFSDVKLKENIVDASSQWEDIKALRVRNYNYKESTGYSTHRQIGVIAQELELVSPGLVRESIDTGDGPNGETEFDLGTTTKSVNYSVLYMKSVKALQEAMERIETLEAKVAALEAN